MQKPSVVQIFRKPDLNYENIIQSNSKFLKEVDVEYLVYDNLEKFEILDFIKNFPDVRYVRKEFKNLKTSFLDCGLLATNPKIIYLNSEDIINYNNAELLEKIRPSIFKKDLKKVSELKWENFKYDDFNFLMKENKTILEKIKTWLI